MIELNYPIKGEYIWRANLRLPQKVACPTTQPNVLKSLHPVNPQPACGTQRGTAFTDLGCDRKFATKVLNKQ